MDRDRAEGLKQIYWDEVCAEIDIKIDKVLNQLRFTSPEKLAILQERIKTLEEVKGLPDYVMEIQNPETEE